MGCGTSAAQSVAMPRKSSVRQTATLGVVRLDYDYPSAPGDIDHPESHAYPVIYRVVPGLTFEMAQKGVLTEDVKQRFVEAIRFLESQGVCGITGDCGFMMYFQKLARQTTRLPVFMSSLAQLPAVTCSFAKSELIAILTASGESLKPMRPLIKDECGVDANEKRYVMVGCEDVPGFEAVALGKKVDVAKVTPGIVEKVKLVVKEYPCLRAICLECTELPPYADAIRAATGLPVYDAITCCELFVSGLQDNPFFGLNGWQQKWDGKQQDYEFGKHLSAEDRASLVNRPAVSRSAVQQVQQTCQHLLQESFDLVGTTAQECLAKAPQPTREVATLGVVQFDGDEPAAKGEIRHPGSHGYPVLYRKVPGLVPWMAREMAQKGVLPEDVKQKFLEAVKHLESQGVCGITGDCGCMNLHFQKLARQNTSLPVFMSPLAQLPAITCGFAKTELVAILTTSGKSLRPLIKDECGVDANENRYIMVNCQDVLGSSGQKGTPEMGLQLGLKVQKILRKHPNIRAICLEPVEFPPYADAIRVASGLPVYDAITSCAFFISGHKDNPRFGLQNWRVSPSEVEQKVQQ